MTIEDILNALPSREEIANAVSGHARNPGADLLPALGIFGTGMLLGAGLAFLLAPTTGQQLRHKFAETLREAGHTFAQNETASAGGTPADGA